MGGRKRRSYGEESVDESSNGNGDGGMVPGRSGRIPSRHRTGRDQREAVIGVTAGNRGREDFAKERHETVRLLGRTAEGPGASPALALKSCQRKSIEARRGPQTRAPESADRWSWAFDHGGNFDGMMC
jgi:hypothetical protein